MSDRLKLSDPAGDAELKNIVVALEQQELDQRIRQLEKNIAELQKAAADGKKGASAPAAPPNNKIGARKDSTFKAISTTPSVNKTPVGPSMVPIPYPTVQDLSNSINTARSVKFNGKPAYLLDQSTQPKGKGDEPGTGKGVKSGTVTGEVKPAQGCKTVRIEGKYVVREGDACTMNGGNNEGIFVTTIAPSGAPPRTAVETSNPPVPGRVPSLTKASSNDATSSLLDELKPKSLQEAVLAAIRRDGLNGQFHGPLPPPTLLERKQIAAALPKATLPSAVAFDGDSRSAAQRFVDENNALYNSPAGAGMYGVVRLAGGSDQTARIFGATVNSIGLVGRAATGQPFLRSTSGKLAGPENGGIRRTDRPDAPTDKSMLLVSNSLNLSVTLLPSRSGVKILAYTPKISSPDISNSVFHATSSPAQASGVLKGIDEIYLNSESRFGKAFYVALKPETALAELAHHSVIPTTGIRFELNKRVMKILDLTNPSIAKDFGYVGGEITDKTKSIRVEALKAGYNTIKYNSERLPGGINYAIINDYNEILIPQTISPIK